MIGNFILYPENQIILCFSQGCKEYHAKGKMLCIYFVDIKKTSDRA